MSFIWSIVWGWIASWGGLSLVISVAAGLTWWFIPPLFTKLRTIALQVCIGAAIGNVVFTKGYGDGVSVTKDEWNEALIAERRNGEQILRDARTDAVRDTPDSVRKHPWNRDLRKQPGK
jgi:hypothetical protein